MRKMKTPFYGVCDTGSSPEYFETFLSILDAKLIEVERFEIAVKKVTLEKNAIKVMGVLQKMCCAFIHVNSGCMACIGKRKKSCVV